MSEGPTTPERKNPGREGWVRDPSVQLKIDIIVGLARELNERQERVPFPGIEPEAYAKLKAAEEDPDDDTTPIDELLERCRRWGVRVVPAKSSDGSYGGDVYILPHEPREDSILNDGIIRPKHLDVTEVMDAKLKELILLSRSMGT